MTRAGDEGLGLERLPDGVVQLTIRGRDKVNSLDEQDHRDLATIWPELNADPEVRVIVVTGEGRAFCAGGNMEMEQRLAGDYAGVVHTLTEARDLVFNMVNCDKPIISAINLTLLVRANRDRFRCALVGVDFLTRSEGDHPRFSEHLLPELAVTNLP